MYDLSVVGQIQIIGTIQNSSFETNGNLKAGNPSFPYFQYTHTYVGIRAMNVSSFNIGVNNGLTTNKFNYLNFGVYSINSNLGMTDYAFRQIKKYDIPPISPLALIDFGSAVYSIGNPTANYLTMAGRKLTADPDFQECIYGVNSSNSNIYIKSNRIENCDFGIYVSKGNSLGITAIKNYIDCNTYGIGLLLVDRFSSSFIQLNEIYGGLRQTCVNGRASAATGITVAGFNLNNTNTLISQNTIHLYEFGLTGIELNAIKNSIVNFN